MVSAFDDATRQPFCRHDRYHRAGRRLWHRSGCRAVLPRIRGENSTLVNGGLPAFDDDLFNVNRAAAVGGNTAAPFCIDEAAVQYQASATQIETLVDGGLPAFNDVTLANCAMATINIIETLETFLASGGRPVLPGLCSKIQTLIDGGLPAFDDDLGDRQRSAATIDIIDQAGDCRTLTTRSSSQTSATKPIFDRWWAPSF